MPHMPFLGSEETVGFLYICESFKISYTKKPLKFHLFMMRMFFGWTYEPVEGSENK